ncbi:TDRD5 protein, partial [Trogon melanurus]|nr:TDRD5 protein [Trogon melanurus]
MAKQSELKEMLKKEVRSLLIAAKGGLTPAQLEQEYTAMVGKPLPLHDLGFQSTLELAADMPEVVRVCPHEKGTFILKAVADKTTKGIAKLVARQKGGRTRKGAAAKAGAAPSSENPQRFPHRHRAPILPAPVKAKLQSLLSSSSPAPPSGFGKAAFRHFAWGYMQYGFFSLFEVLSMRKTDSTAAFRPLLLHVFLLNMQHCLSPKKPSQIIVFAAAPVGEVPPLEPSCETAEEKSEPTVTQTVGLGDGLKQPQDLEQSLLDKLILAPEIPPDAVQDRSLCGLPPLERGCMVGVLVGFIVSPSQFYINVCSRETPYELQDMMFEMRHLYSYKLVSDRYIMPESSVRPGQLCCIMVANWWYRVIIHRVINDQEVEVFYADYGNLEIVRKSCLRFLKWCYLKLPAQAIPCSLAGVKPVEDTWPNAATRLFKQLCGSNLLVGLVDEYVNGILHLFLCDTSTKEDVYFHTVLMSGGYAEDCRANIPSQGFMKLNPLALYVRPSGQEENDELVESDLHLKQESLDADGETATSKVDGDELCEEQRHPSAERKTQDNARPLLHEASVPKTTDEDPELVQEDTNNIPTEQEDTNEIPTELMTGVKTPHSLGESSMPVVLLKSVEDFYSSFVYSELPAEVNRDNPDQIERVASKAQPRETVHSSVLLMAMPFVLNKCNDEEKRKNKDLPGSLVVGQGSAGGLSDQGSSWKLYVPPRALSVVVASARLATSSGYFQWFPSLRKKV